MSWKTWITNELLTSSALNGNFEIVKDKTDLITAPVSGDETKLLKVNGTYDGFSLAEKMPNLTSGDVGKSLVVNSAYNGYELINNFYKYVEERDITGQVYTQQGFNSTTVSVLRALARVKQTNDNNWWLDLLLIATATTPSATASFIFTVGRDETANPLPKPINQYNLFNTGGGVFHNLYTNFQCSIFKLYFVNSDTRGKYQSNISFNSNVSPTGFYMMQYDIPVQSGFIF